jgi:hypothetical protein
VKRAARNPGIIFSEPGLRFASPRLHITLYTSMKNTETVVKRDRLLHECIKLDPQLERKMAEEGFARDMEDWLKDYETINADNSLF